MRRKLPVLAVLPLLFLPVHLGAAQAPNRESAIKAFCERLKIGEGSVIADIGCGNGNDSFLFADVVGEKGTVYAEEIAESKVKQLRKAVEQKKKTQVIPILGKPEDPGIPDGKVDLIYMRLVFHHFSKPRLMLKSMWQDLKPGGYLVIVDRRKGPLRNWVSMESRQKRHSWTSEMTVVRLAREEGFNFFDLLDEIWYEKDPFVVVFQKPLGLTEPAGEHDLPLSIDGCRLADAIPFPKEGPLNVALIALDRSRAILPALKEKLGSRARIFDIVLEEWALTMEEVPPNPEEVRVEHLRTEEGCLVVPQGIAFHVVLFADSYHRLWEPVSLLASLHRNLAPGGFLVVMDRMAPEGEPRRFSGHRRRVDPVLTRSEIERAGFRASDGIAPPAEDRFGLIFRPKAGQRWVRAGRAAHPALRPPGDGNCKRSPQGQARSCKLDGRLGEEPS